MKKKIISLFVLAVVISLVLANFGYSDIVTDNEFTLKQNNASESFVLKDSYVRKLQPTSNFGSAQSTYVERGFTTFGSTVYNRTRRTYYELDLNYIKNNSNYGGGSIREGILNITTDGHSDNPPIGVYKFNGTWAENTITWNNQPCGNSFTCSVNTKVVPSQVKNDLPNGDHIWSINITALINEALNEGQSTLNLVFKFEEEVNPIKDLQMFSKENTLGRTPQTLDIKI